MAEFDIVIHGGRLIDGTGNPWFYGDVGIKNGRIFSIGKIGPENGKRAISAKGHVVAPGFIDMHTHSDQPVIADGNAESKVRQGVTLDIIGESQTVAPLAGAILEEYRAEHRQRNGIETDWSSFTGYFNRVMRAGISLNVASGVSPQQVKRVVCGFEERPANASEQKIMNRLVAEAMEEGALGLTAAWHAKGPENPEEVVEMAKVAKRGNAVLEGRLAAFLAVQEKADALKVWLTASDDVRAQRVSEREGGDKLALLHANDARQRSDAKRYREIYGFDLDDTSIYDLKLESDDQSPEALAERILQAAKQRFRIQAAPS